jgi:adenylate kinase family enzyme
MRSEPLVDARRIIVYGATGSGKSTAAALIAARLGLPAVDVDALTWLPGWVEVDRQRQREVIARIAAGDAWVLDAAYSMWLDLVLPRAQLVVGLDYPRWLSFQRLVRRTAGRLVRRTPTCNGNYETLASVLGRDSILRWHATSWPRKRDRMRAWAEAPEPPPAILFRRPRDLRVWIASLRPALSREAVP